MLPHYTAKTIFFADLINRPISIPNTFYIFLFLINGLLIFLLGRRFLKKNYSFVPLTVYLVSPWFYYLTLANSFYIFLLSSVLLTVFGFSLLETDKKQLAKLLIFAGFLLCVYSSFFLAFIFPLVLVLLWKLKIFKEKTVKEVVTIMLIIFIPILIVVGLNRLAFKNIIHNEITIFQDPGLLNTVNRYQGDAYEDGYKILSRLSQNKYLFFSEYAISKFITQLVPETFFSPQYKLLGFSFNPPILLGFLIPLVYGVYKALDNKKIRNLLPVFLLFVLPSVFGSDLVSLNRLVLFSPVLIFLISYGLIIMYKNKDKKSTNIFLKLFYILIIFQLLLIIFDTPTKELKRSEKYLDGKYIITQQ